VFVAGFEATLHSFYTVLSGSCARHQVMLVGTRHYVSRTVLDVPDERAIGSSTSRFGSPPTRQHASHLLRGRNCRTQRVVPDASWERALVEPIAIQKLNCDPHVAGGSLIPVGNRKLN
jgi:hypothetical protein